MKIFTFADARTLQFPSFFVLSNSWKLKQNQNGFRKQARICDDIFKNVYIFELSKESKKLPEIVKLLYLNLW